MCVAPDTKQKLAFVVSQGQPDFLCLALLIANCEGESLSAAVAKAKRLNASRASCHAILERQEETERGVGGGGWERK